MKVNIARLFLTCFLLIGLLTSCEKRPIAELEPDPFLTHAGLQGIWEVYKWNGTRGWLYLVFERDSTVTFIVRSHPSQSPFKKKYGIRDSVIIDQKHPYGNGLFTVLETDGYDMDCRAGSWLFSVKKLNLKFEVEENFEVEN